MSAFLLLLTIVNGGEPVYGRQLARTARQVEDVVYPTLRRLESLGLLSSKEEDVDSHRSGHVRRRYYQPTKAGFAATAQLLTDIERVADTSFPALRPPTT